MPELQSSDRPKDLVPPQIQGPEINTTSNSSTEKTELVATGDISKTLDILRTAGTSTETMPLVEIGTKVSLPGLNGSGDTFTATVVGHKRVGNEVFTIVQTGPDYPETPNKQYSFSPQDFEKTFRAGLDKEANSERVLNTIVQDILQPELDKKGEITLTKANEIVAKATDILMDNELDDEVADVATELREMIKNHNADVNTQLQATSPQNTSKESTTITETQTKRITEDELKNLQNLPVDQFVAQVVEQLTAQFPDSPIPSRMISDQSTIGSNYETPRGNAKKREKTKNEVSTAIENALNQHNEKVLVKVEQRVSQQLNKLIASADGKQLPPEALSDLRKNLVQLVTDTGAESYIKLRNDIESKIKAYNSSSLDQEISDTENKYTNQTKELLTQHPNDTISKDAESAFLQKIAAELKDTRSAKYIASLQQSISAQIAEHRNQFAKKAEAEKLVKNKAALTAEVEQILKTNPNIKTAIDNLTNKLAIVIQSTNTNPTVQQQNLEQVINEASTLAGMTPRLLNALKGNWNELLKTHTERAPLLAQVQSLVAPYLEKTDTKIGKDAITEVATALNALPNLTAAQRNALLKDILNRFNEHNQNLLAKAAASTPPPLPKGVNLPPIPQSKARNKPEEPTALDDDAYEVGDELEPATLIERDMSDPTFNAKADKLDELASKLQNDLTKQKSNHNELIDPSDFHNQLVNMIVDAGLTPVSLEAKQWLAIKEENVSQINAEIEKENMIEATVNQCLDEIDANLDRAAVTTPEELTDLQNKINTLPAGKEKTELQSKITEIEAHNKALETAAGLLNAALDTKKPIDELAFKIAIGKVLPRAVDNYFEAANNLITDHNSKFSIENETTDTTEVVDNTGADQSVEPDTSTNSADLPAEPDTVVEPTVNTVQSPTHNAPAGQKTVAFNTMAIPSISPQDRPDTQVAPSVAVTPDPIAVPAPEADVLGVAPVVTPVDVPVDLSAAPKSDVRSVPAVAMTPEQKLSLEKSRDQIVDLVEKNLILSEEEKTRLVVKAVELLRTADKNTNVLAELQKLMVAGERHQAIQDALLNSAEIADQIQTAVVDALDTSSLDHKTSDAAFQEVLASLPTDQARASLQAIYDQAIGDKKLRGNQDKIKALVEKALAEQADQNSSRTESLKPLFKKINDQVKAHLQHGEAQVLGSQTIEPSLADWEKPVPTEAELAAEKMTRTQKLRQKLGRLVDRIRGKTADTASEDTQDDVSETADTPKSQADIVAGMVDTNPDLTADEKAKLKTKVLELLENGTDINKTLEQLKATLADRDEVNKKITALVLDAPDLSKQMYFTLSAALQDDLSEEKRREALTKWQTLVDAQITSRAKQVLTQVYQAAIKDRNLSGNVDKLEEMIANRLAETGMIDARRDAVLNLVETLSTEINKAITARKGPDTPKAEILDDQPKNTEVVTQTAPDQTKAPEVVADAPQVSEVLAAQPKDQVENNDAAEKQKQFLVGIESLIASAKKIGVDLDQATLHMYALKSDKLDKALLGDTLAKIDQLLAGKAVDSAVATVKAAVNSAPEKTDIDPKEVDQKLRDQLVEGIKAINLGAQIRNRDIAPKELFASDLDQLMKATNTLNDANLNQELKAIRTLLVDTSDDEMIGGEAVNRLESALAKYPELLKTIRASVISNIQDHNTRIAMAAEIAKREAATMANILTIKPDDIRTQIKALESKFGSLINKHAVENALAKLNDTLRLAQNTAAAMTKISTIWDTEPTLALDKVKQVLVDEQLDPQIMDKIVDILKQTAPVINEATAQKRKITGRERGHVMFDLIPDMSNVPVALKQALAKKMTTMFDSLDKQNTASTEEPVFQSA